MKQLQEIKSPLLKRKELVFELEHFQKPTPKESEIKKSLAEKLKISEDIIHIKQISTHFGSNKSKITIEVYDSKEELEKNLRLGKKAKEKLQSGAAEDAKENEAPAQNAETPKKEGEGNAVSSTKEASKEGVKAKEIEDAPKEA